MVQTQATQPEYILGHSRSELDRLVEQSRFYGDLTEQVLRLAGITTGMRVLDLGCGPGDVSFLVARMVGPEGSVIGVDKSPEAIAAAQRRAAGAGVTNVRFEIQDIAALEVQEPVDAIVGRLILMYLPNAPQVLRQALRSLKPGGIVAFQEMDMASATSEPYCELVELSAQRIVQTFERAGLETRCGMKLGQIFRSAGLPSPDMIQGARVESGPDSEAYRYMQQTMRTLLPLMERTGVATAAEVDIETLADRLRDEVVAVDAVVVPPPMIGAWTRSPSA